MSGMQPSVLLNCSPRAIAQFPEVGLGQEERLEGGFLLFVFVAMYMFWALAILCDIYFVPAMEQLAAVLKLSDDVAGATIMAASSSAPELATTLIGSFVAQDDIGLSAVVGSAVFNLLFVIALCAFVVSAPVVLEFWPVTRDCSYYVIAIFALFLTIRDGLVQWYESAALLALYTLYVALMHYNEEIGGIVTRKLQRFLPEDATVGFIDAERPSETDPLLKDEKEIYTRSNSVKLKEVEEEELLEHPFWQPASTSCPSRLYWFFSLPITTLLFVTMPCQNVKRWYPWIFVISVLWICTFSYVAIWMITVLGFTFSIPDTVMALTFLAFGASVPDAIASVIVIRQTSTHANMALCNAIGSNIFDILLCLGAPWFLRSAINGFSPIQVFSNGLVISTAMLLITVVLLIVLVSAFKWRLSSSLGVLLLLAYFAFISLACVYEYGLIVPLGVVECPFVYN